MRKAETEPEDDLRSEYQRADLNNGVRGKHFEGYEAGTNLALLSPDVRAAFPTDKSIG